MSADDHDDPKTQPVLFGWNMYEFYALGLAVGALVLWVLAFLLFGFAGLITVGLGLVAVAFVSMLLIMAGR